MVQVAKRPAGRTVQVDLSGDFAGWSCTARGDFPAGLLADLASGDVGRIVSALDGIVLTHNFPGSDDQLAPNMAAVDPYDGLIAAGTAIFEAIGKLPNRPRQP